MKLERIAIMICVFITQLICGQNVTEKDSISTNLNEVIIKNEKKTFTNDNGNIKVDVANSIYNSVTNTIDLLAKLPTIQLSSDKENISVVGKGNAIIYIDNQKVTINDLNNLAVEDIKNIEIIKNPSSKYEANAQAVILITRKLSKKDGFQTTLSKVMAVKKSFNNYLGLNADFKKNKLEWKVNFNYNQLQPWESHSIYYQIPNANVISNYDVFAFTKRTQFIFGTGLFYKINDDDYLSFNIDGKFQNDGFDINTKTFNKKAETENNVLTLSENNSDKNYANAFFNYLKKISAIDAQLFTGFQYSDFRQNEMAFVQNNFNDNEFELSQNRKQDFNINVFSGRFDLEKKLKNDYKIEIGALYLSAKGKTKINFSDFDTNKEIASNYYLNEKNIAAYTQLSGKIKKNTFLIGFRVENTDVTGKFKSDSIPLINKNYVDFFPKFQFEIPIDSLKSITLNYSKSIIRPNYSAMNQGATYINPFYLYARNINLDPTINNEIATSFQYKNKSVRLSYYQNGNPVYSSYIYDDLTNILSFKEVNFDKESGFNLDFTLPFEYEFWTSTNSLTFTINKIEDSNALAGTSKPYLYYYSNNMFKLPKQYTISLTAWGLTQQKEGVFERNTKFVIDFAISKTFFKSWNCTLSFNDIFKGMIYEEGFTINNVSSQAKYLVDSHEISLAIKYSFGKIKNSDFKEKSIDENASRIR